MSKGKKLFDKAFVINLPFKQDRLSAFMSRVPQCVGQVTVWPAIHGDTVLHPNWWTAGNGAWGCYRSHLGILEHCYNTGVENYIVFEDDAIFRPEFEEQLSAFMAALPDDWEQCYLGGQLLHEVEHPPRYVNENCLIPYNVNRTHCFAVHRRGYQKLYQHLHATPFSAAEHIDHHLGRLHEWGTLRLYVPPRWLVGQDGGQSNISGNVNAVNFWGDPESLVVSGKDYRPIPAVFLEAPLSVALELSRRGWHRGYWVNEEQLDRGVCDAMSSEQYGPGLETWFNYVRTEGARDGAKCVCLYHPKLTVDQVDKLKFAKFFPIKANSVEEAEALFADLMNRCSTQ